MVHRIILSLAVAFLLFSVDSAAAGKSNACSKLLDPTIKVQRPGGFDHLAAASACTVLMNQDMAWLISDWVVGNELYKGYQNPSQTCTDPYPFTVEEVSMVLYFYQACDIYVSVDVESIDNSTPSCPVPGDMLSISSEYTISIPAADLYEVTIPLDEPVAVNGPYFVGFFLSFDDPYTMIDLVTDSVPIGCTTFNIWDEMIGYIDLNNNNYYDFPGRIFLFSYGTTGGNSGGDDTTGTGTTNPEPSTVMLKPLNNELIQGQPRIWASETSGSSIIDYMAFDYRSLGGGWNLIGYDFDGTRILRNGVDPAGAGDGFSILWDYTVLPENQYLAAIPGAGYIGTLRR